MRMLKACGSPISYSFIIQEVVPMMSNLHSGFFGSRLRRISKVCSTSLLNRGPRSMNYSSLSMLSMIMQASFER
jgi:hypothetical protein